MYKGWAHRPLHRDLQWSIVLPLLFIPSAILRFERKMSFLTSFYYFGILHMRMPICPFLCLLSITNF
jgi:hypothetical protein